MKNTVLTAAGILIAVIPWSILPLRSFDWALESPAAEIIISAYAAFMIAGGIYTAVCYLKMKVQNIPMKACLLINGLYAAFGLVVLGMMFLPQ